MRSLLVVFAFCGAALAAPASSLDAHMEALRHLASQTNLTKAEDATILEISARTDSLEKFHQEYENLRSTNAELYEKVSPIIEQTSKMMDMAVEKLGAEIVNQMFEIGARLAARQLKEQKGKDDSADEAIEAPVFTPQSPIGAMMDIGALKNLTEADFNTLLEIAVRTDSIEKFNQEYDNLRENNRELYDKIASYMDQSYNMMNFMVDNLGPELSNYIMARGARFAAEVQRERTAKFVTTDEIRGEIIKELEAYINLSNNSRKMLSKTMPYADHKLLEIIYNVRIYGDEQVQALAKKISDIFEHNKDTR